MSPGRRVGRMHAWWRVTTHNRCHRDIVKPPFSRLRSTCFWIAAHQPLGEGAGCFGCQWLDHWSPGLQFERAAFSAASARRRAWLQRPRTQRARDRRGCRFEARRLNQGHSMQRALVSRVGASSQAAAWGAAWLGPTRGLGLRCRGPRLGCDLRGHGLVRWRGTCGIRLRLRRGVRFSGPRASLGHGQLPFPLVLVLDRR